MPITSIIILVAVILVITVIVSIILTKREQAAALRRQRAASCRLKADEAQDLYDGLQVAGLEKAAYKFLLERVVANLKEAYDISPNSPGIKIRLDSAVKTLGAFDNQSFLVQMPSNMTELHGLVGRLNKYIKYLKLLLHNKTISDTLYQQLLPSIQRSSIKFDVEGHIKMGHQATNSGQAGTAKQSYLHAKEKILESGTEDAYAQKQLAKVEELLEELERQYQSTFESSQISDTGNSGIPKAEDDASDKAEQTISTQKELNKKAQKDLDFNQKKKW